MSQKKYLLTEFKGCKPLKVHLRGGGESERVSSIDPMQDIVSCTGKASDIPTAARYTANDMSTVEIPVCQPVEICDRRCRRMFGHTEKEERRYPPM
jgi:hypothetical protein